MSETEARHAADATPVEPVHPADPEAQPSSPRDVGKHLLTDAEAGTDVDAGTNTDAGTDPVAADAAAGAEPEAAEPEAAEPEGTEVEGAEAEADEQPQREPSWWHRSHPTFAGLVGFFVGVAYVIIIPGVYATLLNWLVPEKTAERLFPLVLIALIVPVGMLVLRKTRRFAEFMFLGIISTALVVAATATLVLWVLVQGDK